MWWEQTDGTPGLNGVRVASLPLYGVHLLAELPLEVPVFLVGGETTRDALTAGGLAAVGTVTSAKSIPDDDVLRLLLGRPIVVWEDRVLVD
jgi:hypothetical protein